jgi:C-terminal processing protease CtpA/Prc
VLDEDKEGNVFVKSIDKGSRAEKCGQIFEGDIVAMCSATFGDDMWSCRGVGLTRVMATIKVRNSKPVRLVLEGPNEMEEKKRRAIAYKEKTEEEKAIEKAKADQLLSAMVEDDKELLTKRKGLFGLW